MLAESKNFPHVVEVKPKSAAEQAGIEIGDELTEIDGKPAKLLSLDAIISKLEVNGQEYKQTKTLTLRRMRDGKIITLNVDA